MDLPHGQQSIRPPAPAPGWWSVRPACVSGCGAEHLRAGADHCDSELTRRSTIMECALTTTRPPALRCRGAGERCASPGMADDAVSSTTVQPRPNRAPGSVNVTGWLSALNSSRNVSSRIRSPRGSGSLIASPFRNTPSALAYPVFQSSPVISRPDGVSQAMSPGLPPVRPSGRSKNRRLRNTGWLRRNAARAQVNSCISFSWLACSQSTQEISLSWQYALLLPCWVRPISSPPSSIGTPWDRNRVARNERWRRARSPSMPGSSDGPSTPLFHELLSLAPSWLFSPLASLCLSLYVTRSRKVNPSWAVRKLMLPVGTR